MGLLTGAFVSSCNEKTEDAPEDNYVTTESVAITSFSLSADLRVMKNLDSVYFSIDSEHGVVFNADSLPKGTNVTKLIPKISYPSSVKTAVIEMTGGTHREGTVNYMATTTDTIDFTGRVTITLGTSRDEIQKTYVLKVNVHKEDPDTMYWNRTGQSELPSRMPSPRAQKSVAFASGVFTLIEEADGTYTSASTADIFNAQWTKTATTFPATPVIETLTSDSAGALYLLDSEGNLLKSADGADWQPAASGWDGIIGMYGDTLLGIDEDIMTSYPEGAYYGIAIPEGFPRSGYSAPIEFNNRWSDEPTIVIFGGLTSAGLSSASWAFDGSQWVNVADTPLPALEGLSVVNYYSYLNSATNGLLREFEAYLAFGGRDDYGNSNETVYITYDHGISWQKAQQYMQLPSDLTAGYLVNALTLGSSMESNLNDRWKERRRLPFEIDGDILKWNCPYIFLFGGYDSNMTLNPGIRSGVLQRLTFAPLF